MIEKQSTINNRQSSIKLLVFLFKKHLSAVDFYDDGVISIRYRLVRMWEVEGRELLESGDPYLLPLVALAKSGEEEIFEAEESIYSSQLDRSVKADLLTISFSGLKDYFIPLISFD